MTTNQTKNNNQNNAIEEIDIKELVITILKKWYVFVIVGVLCLSFAIYKIFSTPPVFTTTGTVLVRSDNNLGASMMVDEFSMTSEMMGIGKLVDDEMIVLQSKTIMKQMVESLMLQTKAYYKKRLGGEYELFNNEPLIVIYPDGYKKNIKGSLTIEVEKTQKDTWKFKFTHKLAYKKTKFKEELTDLTQSLETPWGKFSFIEDTTKIDPKYPNYELRFVTVPLKSRIEEYCTNVGISLSNKKANAININIEGGNIAKNEAIVNKIIELYELDALNDKNKTAHQMSSFINTRIEQLTKELYTIENQVEQYRIDKNLADISIQSQMTIESLSQYEKVLSQIDMEYSLMTFIENYILNSDIFDLIPSNTGVEDVALSNLIIQYNEQVMEYLRLTRSTNEDNPFISQLKNKILLTRQNILQTITNIKKGTEIKRQDIIARNNSFLEELTNVPTIEREYVEISREQGVKRNLYLFLLRKREDIQLSLASNINTSKVVDLAYTSVFPVAPNKKLLLLIAIFITGIVGLAYIYIESLINNKVEDKKILRKLTSLPIIGTIPLLKNKTSNVVMHSGDNNATAEMIRALRTNLKFAFKNPTDKVVMITSSHAGEGKTFVSINLALSLAMINKKVALVGLDIRIPRLAEYLSLKATPGITDYLSETAYTEEDIKQVYPENSNLNVFVAGSLPPNPSELLSNPRLAKLIEYLKANYDYVIIDSAPVGLTSDTIQLAHFSDTILYVCRQKVTQQQYIHNLNSLVEEKHLQNVSIVLNGTTDNDDYGYGYGKKTTNNN